MSDGKHAAIQGRKQASNDNEQYPVLAKLERIYQHIIGPLPPTYPRERLPNLQLVRSPDSSGQQDC